VAVVFGLELPNKAKIGTQQRENAVTSIWERPIPLWISFSFSAVMMIAIDWGYFFPLSAHNDLRFQVIGASVAALVVFTGLTIAYAVSARARRKPGSRTGPIIVALLQGVFFALATFALEWRDVFPGSRFDPHAIQHSLWSHLFGGCAFGLFTYGTRNIPRKLPKPEENLVS
jgi:hypothetical protein